MVPYSPFDYAISAVAFCGLVAVMVELIFIDVHTLAENSELRAENAMLREALEKVSRKYSDTWEDLREICDLFGPYLPDGVSSERR